MWSEIVYLANNALYDLNKQVLCSEENLKMQTLPCFVIFHQLSKASVHIVS